MGSGGTWGGIGNDCMRKRRRCWGGLGEVDLDGGVQGRSGGRWTTRRGEKVVGLNCWGRLRQIDARLKRGGEGDG